MFDLKKIKTIIPHREPFILIDRVTHNEFLKHTIAEKDIHPNEFWVPGHFPNNPVFPGVLMVEAFAQTGAICILTAPQYIGRIGYFSSIQEVKFKRRVVPGDTLRLEVKLTSSKVGFFFFDGEAFVGDQLVCLAKFSVAVASL
jgi:3-hydroxyacyl-[acyl-carrier-protein] dehydratase